MIVFIIQIFLIQIAFGVGKKQAVENKCHLFGWYLGCLLLLKNQVFQIIAQLVIFQCQLILVIFVLKLFLISTPFS